MWGNTLRMAMLFKGKRSAVYVCGNFGGKCLLFIFGVQIVNL